MTCSACSASCTHALTSHLQDGDDQASTSGRSFEEAAAGQTVVHCGVEGRGVVGAIALSDSLRC